MSTAIEPTPAQQTPVSPRTQLLITSLVGAGFMIAGYFGGVFLAQAIPNTIAYVEFFKLSSLVLGVAAGVFAVRTAAGSTPPRGTRGGIFLIIVTVITIFFITRAVGLNFQNASFGAYLTGAVLAALTFGAFRFLNSERGESLMISLEHQGWFHFTGYKRTQGLHMRRYTFIGVLIVGWTGVWALFNSVNINTTDLLLRLPFFSSKLLVLPSVSLIGFLVLCSAVFWFGLRLVNVPIFADFLIATEAEMNKVSWSTRRQLIQDAIVVLITMFIITTFLFFIDLFWGWLLSVKYIEVLPNKTPDAKQADPTGTKPLAW